ncbi:ATP-binding protein [Leuconostoc pseudomesenteroides]|uniref:ATP-binding protein n=1 Tax=Leuconostoc pseudomesenteroides TaxID=33968 RepID=UPI0021A9F0A7|nr:ATP-binding protein [Leuconostoc pseudomesenteroides]MCT4387071.1 ATP-binding protein [Leuconostoc pseudomesenteroides]
METKFETLFFDRVNQQYEPVRLDNLLAQHLLITGVTGSGKSTTALAIMMGMKTFHQNLIILDPTGEYQSIPDSRRVVLGRNSFLDINHLNANEIGKMLNITHPQLLSKLPLAIESLQISRNVLNSPSVYKKINRTRDSHQFNLKRLSIANKDFDLNLIADQLVEEFVIPRNDDKADFTLLGQQYDQEMIQRVWSDLETLRLTLRAMKVTELPEDSNDNHTVHYDVGYLINLFVTHRASEQSLIIDLSEYANDIHFSQTLIDILTREVMLNRQRFPQKFPVVIFIDEAHRYLPKVIAVDNGIFSILREGRKVGVDLMMSTQSPLDLSAKLIGQFGSLICHRLGSPEEIDALPSAIQNSRLALMALPVGEAFLKITNSSAVKLVQIKPASVEHNTKNISFDI